MFNNKWLAVAILIVATIGSVYVGTVTLRSSRRGQLPHPKHQGSSAQPLVDDEASDVQAPAFSDRFEAYEYWWKLENASDSDFIMRGEQGKRLGKIFNVPTDPPHHSVIAAERDNEIRDDQLVLGVELGGESRAYPVHAMGFELLNDKVGGVPIAAAW